MVVCSASLVVTRFMAVGIYGTGDASFIMEYDVRPNRLFVEYLVYPKEVFGMLWSGYKLELFIGAVVSLATIFFRLEVDSSFGVRPCISALVLADPFSFIGCCNGCYGGKINPWSQAAKPSDGRVFDRSTNE